MPEIIIPASKPKISRKELLDSIGNLLPDPVKYPFHVAGFRGYYKNTLGAPGVNDRGVYDDAKFLITPEHFFPFNANCDPSSYRDGYGFGETKGMASLVANKTYYMWKLDFHKGKYLAFCQRLGECTVLRDGKPPYLQTSRYIGCNGHKGGISTTASLCCQTIPPNQWDDFIGLSQLHMESLYGTLFDMVEKNGKQVKVYRDILVPYTLLEK